MFWGSKCTLRRRGGRFYVPGIYQGDSIFKVIQTGIRGLLRPARLLQDDMQSFVSLPSTDVFTSVYDKREPLVTWIGHATFLIRMAGFTILTDPLFGVPSRFFQRIVDPGIALKDLPLVDLVVISHNHPDHMEVSALIALAKRNPAIRICVPWGDAALLRKKGLTHVHEWGWGESHILHSATGTQNLRITFTPAVHWTRSAINNRNCSLWGSWLLQHSTGTTLYFGGDTAYGSHFKSIKQAYGAIDTAILPIAPSEPHERLRHVHMSAEEAGQSFCDLGASRFIPCHWGTIAFGRERPLDSLKRLQAWWQKTLPPGILSVLKVGESVVCEKLVTTTELDRLVPQEPARPTPEDSI